MIFNSLALKPIVNINDLSGIEVGDSMFTDDVWDLTNYIQLKTCSNAKKKIRFNINNDKIKTVIKQFAYYKLGKIKPQTVIRYVSYISAAFIPYCELKRLDSLEELSFSILCDYMDWLKNEKCVGERYCLQTMYIIIEIVRVGQVKGWKVPSGNLYEKIKTEILAPQNWDFEDAKTQPIPIDIFDKILFNALHNEKNILTKSGIIIQSQTGLRIGEVLAIKKGCLSTTNEGHTFLEVQIGKTEKGEPIAHKVYANELVKAAVLELEEATKILIDKSKTKGV
ncbi:MAG: hypothetical protein R3Y35_12840 [Clostridia bacterium]